MARLDFSSLPEDSFSMLRVAAEDQGIGSLPLLQSKLDVKEVDGCDDKGLNIDLTCRLPKMSLHQRGLQK